MKPKSSPKRAMTWDEWMPAIPTSTKLVWSDNPDRRQSLDRLISGEREDGEPVVCLEVPGHGILIFSRKGDEAMCSIARVW